MRNNYADNDAQPVCKVVLGNALNATLVEAADPDQFWVVDFIAVSGATGQVKIQYDSDRNLANTDPKVVFDYSFSAEDNIIFPPVYRGVKNEPLYIVAPASAKVSIRYR